MIRKFTIAGLLILASVVSAFAQGNCSYIRQGAVLTPGQWNECFAQKQNLLPFTPIPNTGSARSVLGVPGNVNGTIGSIQTSAADQVLRANGTNTGIGWGSLDLSKSGAVGTSILRSVNGGLGIDASAANGVPLFASGTPTMLGTSGTGSVVRADGATITNATLTNATGGFVGAFNGTVGTTTPSTIAGTSVLGSSMTSTTSASGNFVAFFGYNSNGSAITESASLQLGRDASKPMGEVRASNILNGNFADGYLAFLTRRAETMTEVGRFDNTGNFGIGATTWDPVYKLWVNGRIRSVGSVAGIGIDARTGGGVYFWYDPDGNGLQLDVSGSGALGGTALTVQKSTGNIGLGGITSPAKTLDIAGTFQVSSTATFSSLTGVGVVCASLDASGNMGRTSCGGTGLPGGGSLGQVVLNSGSGTGAWATEPFINISTLSGVDCTGVGATVISTAMGSRKSVALPTDCTLRVTGNDSIPAGTFLAIPCGARIQVDGSAVLTLNGETDDNECQKFAASGAGGGSGTGIVRGLMFNRPEWWGAFGDCAFGGSCIHDDYGPVQQALNSMQASGVHRPQIKLGCNKGYGVNTGIVVSASLAIQPEISGCSSLNGGDGNSGSWIIGRSGFTGSVLTVASAGGSPTTTDISVHDFGVLSYNPFQADACLQIGAAGQELTNGAGRSLVESMVLRNCKHLLKFAGKVVSMKFDRIWMTMGSNASASGANASCIEAVPSGTEFLSELSFHGVSCDSGPNSDASAIGFNFHSTSSAFSITGTRIFDAVCYSCATSFLIRQDSSGTTADFWCYSCQGDAVRTGGTGFSLVTSSTGTLADIVIDKSYQTSVLVMDDGLNIDGSAGGTIKNVGVYGFYTANGFAGRSIRVETAGEVNIQGSRFDGNYSSQTVLLNNCTGCLANNNTMRVGSPNGVLMGGATDYSQACNNTGAGTLAAASVSASVASGTHNIVYSACQNN